MLGYPFISVLKEYKTMFIQLTLSEWELVSQLIEANIESAMASGDKVLVKRLCSLSARQPKGHTTKGGKQREVGPIEQEWLTATGAKRMRIFNSEKGLNREQVASKRLEAIKAISNL